MERTQLLEMLKQLYLICQQINADINKKDAENKLVYEVLQFSDIAKPSPSDPRKIVKTVADFYNSNWCGNADFMHIPNYAQIMDNIMHYPIIISREKGQEKILAISTIKYDENTLDQIDPYFPENDAKYFSITGILTKKGTPYRGMGKKIYEIALRGACEYNKVHPGTRMMCVIDSRNSPSLRALSTAVETINSEESVGLGKELPAHVVGYYELKDSSQNLVEAPTLVLEVGLDAKDKSSVDKQGASLNFLSSDDSPLFLSLQQELQSKLKKFRQKSPVISEDPGVGTVLYHPLIEECSVIKTTIASNGTEEGNNRKPWKTDSTEYIQGPVITYRGDDFER